jgi:hypothetical protein
MGIDDGVYKPSIFRIWAENNKDSNGATFSFCLPLASV